MVITDKQVSALLDCIERVNNLNPEWAIGDVYGDLADLSHKVDSLTMKLRECLIQFSGELRVLGLEPPEAPMENPPHLEIDVSGQDVRIVLDAILPYPITGKVYFLHNKLERTLEEYRSKTRLPRPFFTERCAVVFIHHYRQTGKDTAEIRDYDNLERRCILNVLAHNFMRDDSPSCCVTMDTIAPGESNFTEIRLMTLTRFREYVMSDEIEYSPPSSLPKKK